MTKRTKRTRDFELQLQITNDDFLPAPRESQRSWMLNRLMKETSDELEHLHMLANTYVAGTDATSVLKDRTQAELTDQEIMEDWQIPVMKAMADVATAEHDCVLEIGFGRGVGSDFIQEGGVTSHTIIECNASVIRRFDVWKTKYQGRDIRMVPGLWQDAIGGLGEFDAIFFHTYPLNEADFVEQVAQSSTFAEHFFAVATRHLTKNGVFTYLTNECDSLSRPHQRALLEHFSSFSISVLRDLPVPDDTADAMWSNSMVIVKVVK